MPRDPTTSILPGMCLNLQFILKSVHTTYLTSGKNGGQCLITLWLTFWGFFEKWKPLFLIIEVMTEFNEKFRVLKEICGHFFNPPTQSI